MDDMISRQAVLYTINKTYEDTVKGIDRHSTVHGLISAVTGIYKNTICLLPSAQPYTIHSDGRLWVTVDDIDKVNAVVVDESKSKFCKQFYQDANPEPCEDAVSRETILKFFDGWMSALDENCHNQSVSDLKIIKRDFANLPPVMPKQRTGKWVLVGDNNGMHFICNQCGEWRYHQEQEYCGHCGAKMEVTE